MERGKILKVIQATETIADRSNCHISVHDILWCITVNISKLDQIHEKLCLVEHEHYGWIMGTASTVFAGDKTIALKKTSDPNSTLYLNLHNMLKLFLIEKIIKIMN